jgi:hypothetical protein
MPRMPANLITVFMNSFLMNNLNDFIKETHQLPGHLEFDKRPERLIEIVITNEVFD